MPIKLGISNALKSLVDRLVEQLQQTTSVFRPVYIVTQTAGMNIWLKQQLAERLGIAANIHFLKPNDAIHLVFRELSGKYIYQSISAHDLNWLIYDILQEEAFTEQFPKIAEYYNQPGLEGEIKRMALSEKIADLFDQYQVYRAPEIARWNGGENWEGLASLPNETDEAWQKYIWNRAREMAGERFSDKTYIGKYILDELDNPDQKAVLAERIPGLYFFGLSLITEYHLQIIYKVSESVPVEFLFQNPAPWMYWYEDRSERIVDFLKRIGKYEADEQAYGNELLTSLGKLTQNTFKLFFKDDDTLNLLEDYNVIEPEKDTLLHHIQNTIFNNEKQDIHFPNSQIEDGSVTINSCYNPIREVEVLYNYLVHLVDQKNESLSARDIIVMVSDIDLYGSYIRAVFDNAPYRFPYTIADESYVVSDTISNALHAILSLGEGQFTSEKVVSLLEFSALRKRFQIEDIPLIRRVMDAANIRFGFTGNREEETHYVSWEYGLNRIIYGLCMHGGKEYDTTDDSFYPIDMVEGFDMFKVVRFVHFIRVLQRTIKMRNQKRTIAEWVTYVEECLFTFIGEIDEDPDEDYVLLQNQLEQYNRLKGLYDEKTDFEVFRYNFLPVLAQSRRLSNFASYGITFCSLIPMRSIPFKVVALLGMDLNKFPRMHHALSFDLIEKKKQTGDRDLKENDKQLFLDTLLSAESYFYVSYVGQSVKNNEVIPPSALVDELVEYIALYSENPDDVREHFVRKHPLHGFSKSYNTEENKALYSYLLKADTEAKDFFGDHNTPQYDFSEISLKSLMSFFKNPIRAYYNRVLNIYYRDDEVGLVETEKFDLNYLESWSVKNTIVSMSKDKTPVLDQYITENKKKGNLPLRNVADVLVRKLDEDVSAIIIAIQDIAQEATETKIPVRIFADNSELIGEIDGIYNDKLIRYSLSSKADKHKFSAYLEFAALCAIGHPKKLIFIDKEGEKSQANPISQEEGIKVLETCVSLFKEGHSEIFPFVFELGISLKNIDNLDQRTLAMLVTKYINNEYSFPDIYVRKMAQYGGFQDEKALPNIQKNATFLLDIVENGFSRQKQTVE